MLWKCCTQCSSVARSCLTLCNLMDCSTPGFPVTNSWSLLKLMSIKSVMPFNHLIPSFPMSQFFISGGQSIGASASASDFPMSIFRIDWFDFLAVQGTLKSLFQHHSSKASILQQSAFFMVQLLHPYMTTGKTIALTRWSFDSKIMSLLFNMLSSLVITLLSKSKCLNFMAAVTIYSDFGAPQN